MSPEGHDLPRKFDAKTNICFSIPNDADLHSWFPGLQRNQIKNSAPEYVLQAPAKFHDPCQLYITRPNLTPICPLEPVAPDNRWDTCVKLMCHAQRAG